MQVLVPQPYPVPMLGMVGAWPGACMVSVVPCWQQQQLAPTLGAPAQCCEALSPRSTATGSGSGSPQQLDGGAGRDECSSTEDELEHVHGRVDAFMRNKLDRMSRLAAWDLEREMEQDFALDICISWRDLDMKHHGSKDAANWWAKMKEHIPNLRVQLGEVVMDGSSKAQVTIHWSGTQHEPIMPMFPVGKWLQGMCINVVEFDNVGKIKADDMQLCFNGNLSVAPSNFQWQWLSQCARKLASREGGCWMLQNVVEAADDEDKLTLVRQFHGHVWDMAGCPHANFVLQKCVVHLPPQHLRFIAEELKGRAVDAARHGIRSRLLERLLEHFPAEQLDCLVGELLAAGVSLSRNSFGNFVLQRVLEHGTATQRSALAQHLSGAAVALAQHSIANNVLKSVLVNCSLQDRRTLANALTADRAVARSLAHHRAASFVMREVKLLRRGIVNEVSL